MVQSSSKRVLITASWLLPLTLLAHIRSPFSAEAGLLPSVKAEYISQRVDRQNEADLSLQSYSVAPALTAFFNSRTIDASFSGTHTYLKRDNEALSTENNFSTYRSFLTYSLLEDLITFNAQSSMQYRPDGGQNFILANFISNPDALAKTTNHNLAATLETTQGDYINTLLNASYTQLKVTRAQSATGNDIDSKNASVELGLSNGDNASFVYWQADASLQESRRGNNAYGNFRSINSNAEADFMMLPWLGIRLSGTTERYDTSAPDSAFDSSRQYNTYGAGLTYRQSPYRVISVTLNGVDSQTDSADDDNFIAADVKWAFSNRTGFFLRLNKRFFGRSAQSALRYNSKYFRSTLGYTETVTNATRLLSSVEDLGLFVCPASFTDISECQQPDSVDYTPQPGETLAQFSQNVFELDDNIILRKALNAAIGYSFSRLQFNLSLRRAEDDYLDLERLRSFDSVTLTGSFAASRDTKIVATLQYSDSEGQSQELIQQESTAKRISLDTRHTLSDHLSAYLTLTIVDQEGDFETFGFFGNNFTDTQLALGLRYQLQ
ncbi:hypothetical protein [Alteromonas gilva]|uniref:TIGR03016 family PEP-CTERM system-associated outer membrane protein n=1 Tax=Alteromonas gilva TaxID=2987522 RepID=A0ABT5L395_9ALTE|nr:hypothetical protein [Alteromonas gilva]MDC8830317.1 hypothetical protein [Alteromonas gilva]